MEYIVVQAGGKGTRLGYLTYNKPKALVPVNNLPMVFLLFRQYPDKRFIIISDYKKDVFRKYMDAFADVKYQMVEAKGKGTLAGIKQAMDLLPDEEPFMLIWSDLILSDDLELPKEYVRNNVKPEYNYVGISETFSCRWKYENGEFAEDRSVEHGVAGMFLFREKAELSKVPESGEFVRYLQESRYKFRELGIGGTKEYGVVEEYEKIIKPKCRPFNRVSIEGEVFIKEPIDDQGRMLAKKERSWYLKAKDLQIDILPEIYEIEPLKMELIHGKNIYEYQLPYEKKKNILQKLVGALHKLHMSESIPADSFSLKEVYFRKTMKRLHKIEDLVPFAREKFVRVNGRNCRNVFFYKDRLEKKLSDIKCYNFNFIHGDCTFSNMMLRDDGTPVLIDPRGYFGFTELYGDVRYDWAKLYYSVVGNYDRFNLQKFRLSINEEEVNLSIESNGWEDMENDFFALTGADAEEIRLLHAIIWLSLTTYAWQDYDSICGAFYNGLYYLEEVL